MSLFGFFLESLPQFNGLNDLQLVAKSSQLSSRFPVDEDQAAEPFHLFVGMDGNFEPHPP